MWHVLTACYTHCMKQLHLFLGENSHMLREEKKRWISEFVKRHGQDNLVRLDAQGLSIRALLDEVSVLPFLAERRLVVIDGIPTCSREEIEALSNQMHPQVIVLFCLTKIDKRLSGSKELLERADVKEFSLLKGKQLFLWLKGHLQERAIAIQSDAQELLLDLLGNDQDLLTQEIDKLSLLAAGRSITRADVEEMTIPSDEGVVWHMTDLLCSGAKTEAARAAKRMMERGSDPYGLWAILLSHLKNVVLVHAARAAGSSGAKDIAEKTGVNVFALRSLLPYVTRLQAARLRAFLSWAVRSEKDLKTGALRATDESPQEIQCLIDQFILTGP